VKVVTVNVKCPIGSMACREISVADSVSDFIRFLN